ncbi:MAG: hypothetical protein FJY11_08145 [Bacteroidetes bacterium]|nr:hypothetical protein [Bacteroidota bacterium]
MKNQKPLLIHVLAIIVAFLPLTQLTARQKVPITFNKYHGYTGTVDYLKKVAAAHPDITELIQIGTSALGRPIYVLAISNMKNGTTIDKHVKLENMRAENVKNVPPMKTHMGKPGHYISGATHGNEYTANELCLYIIDKLVSGYGDDKDITSLVDRVAFYICPIDNPDGVFNSVEMGIPQRSNSMYRDKNLEGTPVPNGLIPQFRYKHAEGEFVIDDADPRLMVRLRPNETTTKQRYRVITEYRDDAGNLRKGQLPSEGIDVNRNYPEGWWTEEGKPGGQGHYPTSSPEAHAIAEFFMNYRNILNANFYHTSGGFTYRPMGTAPNTAMHETDIAYYDFVMGRKYIEILGEQVPEEWLNPGRLEEFKASHRERGANKYVQARGYEFPYFWKSSYNERTDQRYGYGMVIDWLHAQQGIYALTTELWNPAKDIPGLKVEEGPERQLNLQRALLRHQDEKYNGSLFVKWKPFKHPEHGEGEIGGWRSIYSSNNAWPGEPLLYVCENHWKFELYRAGLLPDIRISQASARVIHTGTAGEPAVSYEGNIITLTKGKGAGRYRLVEVTATIENAGALPTQMARGTTLTNLREDVVWLVTDRKNVDFIEGSAWRRIGVLGGTTVVPGVIRGGNNKSEVKWMIGVKGDVPLKIVVTSQKGGTAVQELTIK